MSQFIKTIMEWFPHVQPFTTGFAPWSVAPRHQAPAPKNSLNGTCKPPRTAGAGGFECQRADGSRCSRRPMTRWPTWKRWLEGYYGWEWSLYNHENSWSYPMTDPYGKIDADIWLFFFFLLMVYMLPNILYIEHTYMDPSWDIEGYRVVNCLFNWESEYSNHSLAAS